MEQTMQQRRRRRAFTPAFKAEVVELCRKGNRSIPEVARDLDLTDVRSARQTRPLMPHSVHGIAEQKLDGVEDGPPLVGPRRTHLCQRPSSIQVESTRASGRCGKHSRAMSQV